MNKNMSLRPIGLSLVALIWAVAAQAAPPKDPPTKCALDAVLVGAGCMDTYEASVWRIPDPFGANKGLVKNVKKGKAEMQDLIDGGATQLGTASDNYAPCTDNGQNCANDIFAVSLPAVTPARYITWFQAQEACTNSAKRLPSNAEWQAAANGTPDPGGDNGTTDCNTASTFTVAATGSRSLCLSSRGAYDMVGNLFEWVADWAPLSTACPGWGAFSNDYQCFAGADTTTTGGPGALLRGGDFAGGTGAGPLAVDGGDQPSGASASASVARASHFTLAILRYASDSGRYSGQVRPFAVWGSAGGRASFCPSGGGARDVTRAARTRCGAGPQG